MGHVELDTFLLMVPGVVLLSEASKTGALDGVRVVEEVGGYGLLRNVRAPLAQVALHLLYGADEVGIHL